jgi:hypothetical protein
MGTAHVLAAHSIVNGSRLLRNSSRRLNPLVEKPLPGVAIVEHVAAHRRAYLPSHILDIAAGNGEDGKVVQELLV